ncbi:MAG: TraB/GumN family protein [Gammaproteobacteria bacterium]
MNPLLRAALCAAMVSAPCAASTTYDPATGTLDIPCVYAGALDRPDAGAFTARLKRIGSSLQFAVEQLQPVAYDIECSGAFHLGTQLYSDNVNAGDVSYRVLMRRGTDGNFALESATLQGPATAAVWVARNGANVVYLAGTVHLLRDSDYPLPRAYDRAYAQSSELYFELDYSNPDESGPITQERFDALVRDPEGRRLSELLTTETYELFRDYLQRTFNVDVASIDHWSAQVVANVWLSRHLRQVYGVDAEGVDRHLAQRALSDGKRVQGFETLAGHYEILHTMDEGSEERVIDNFLFALLSGGDLISFENLVRDWRRGDTNAIASRIVTMRENDNADYLLLHANRNRAWIPRIEEMLHTPQTEMVVVGMAHMAGPEGLVTLLRERGYDVRRYVSR